MDFLKSAVASAISGGPPFPYSFGDRVDVDDSIWTLYNGTRRVSQLQVFKRYVLTGILGGWLELQHLLIRRTSKQVTTASGKKRR
jgi:hypothetical protein